jgi:hypothetical protein
VSKGRGVPRIASWRRDFHWRRLGEEWACQNEGVCCKITSWRRNSHLGSYEERIEYRGGTLAKQQSMTLSCNSVSSTFAHMRMHVKITYIHTRACTHARANARARTHTTTFTYTSTPVPPSSEGLRKCPPGPLKAFSTDLLGCCV